MIVNDKVDICGVGVTPAALAIAPLVTEAKKAAEANLIARREETAAMRSQANTAKLLEASPTLMRPSVRTKESGADRWRSWWRPARR